jgi:hypothetical protein
MGEEGDCLEREDAQKKGWARTMSRLLNKSVHQTPDVVFCFPLAPGFMSFGRAWLTR